MFADSGCQEPEFQKAITQILRPLETDIIKRSKHAEQYVVLQRRFVVERTSVRPNCRRRLVTDCQNLNRTALEFLHLAPTRVMF
jgi:transposase